MIGQMRYNGYITPAEAEAAIEAPLGASAHHLVPESRNGAAYFAEDVRGQLSQRYGDDKLYEGGMSVRTTLDRHLQAMAHAALIDGLVNGTRLRAIVARSPMSWWTLTGSGDSGGPEGARRRRALATRHCAPVRCRPRPCRPAALAVDRRSWR